MKMMSNRFYLDKTWIIIIIIIINLTSIQMDYPPELIYSNVNPKGFFSTFKQWIVQPIASGGCFWPGQNVRILIQSVISGVMDPYRSHIEIQVQVDPALLPVGALQVDSSAQSFIEQLVINSKNRQIQRIPQYSVLAAWLTDIGLAQVYAQGRQTQGLGFSNIESVAAHSKNAQYNGASVYGQFEDDPTPNNYTSRVIANFPSVFPTQRSTGLNTRSAASYTGQYSKSETNRMIKGHIGHTNTQIYRNDTQQKWCRAPGITKVVDHSLLQFGYVRNIRAQYLQSILSSNYTDSTASKSQFDIRLNQNVLNGNPDAMFQKGETYTTRIADEFRFNLASNSEVAQYNMARLPNTTNLTGYTNLYSPHFCKGVKQPFISPTIPQCQMKNGRILPQKIPIVKRTFKIPLISAIMGLLIPEDQFVLIPIRALNQILIEIVLDRYAMFTSGYNDMSQFDESGMMIQQERCFKIKRLNYKMHTYQFYDVQIDKYLAQSLASTILLNVNMWTLGNQYQIIKGQNLNNTWPVACTSQALNQIVVLFVPLDYQRYSFCRKHFRISNNVTKFQLRVNMEYFPSQPLLGNGGNPVQLEGADNSTFVQQIFWSNNFMFNKINPWPRINAHNFAINERCYNPTRTETFYDRNMLNSSNLPNTSYVWNNKSVNQDTAMGMPSIHENRFVGKAGYVYGFEPYAHSAYHLTGLDCRQVRQFDVLLNTNPIDNFPREQTMYVFTRSSCIIQYTENGINVYGR